MGIDGWYSNCPINGPIESPHVRDCTLHTIAFMLLMGAKSVCGQAWRCEI